MTVANGIDICFDTFGDRSNPALLFIMGLGAQLIEWPEPFCRRLAETGVFVIRYDNRDVGRSTRTRGPLPSFVPHAGGGLRLEGPPPYDVADMAADAVGLLDALDVGRANICGASLGGTIAQRVAADHPDRVLTLTSIMSSTGAPTPGRIPSASSAMAMAMASLNGTPAAREEYVEAVVAGRRLLSGPHFDTWHVRELAGRHWDRGHYPQGILFQLAAGVSSGDQADALQQVSCPTLVIHGALDPLAPLAGGIATAEAIPGARLLVFEDMGHELPPALWPDIAAAIGELTTNAAANP